MRILVDPDPKHCLKEAKACLEKTIGEDAIKIGVHLDSWILSAKLPCIIVLSKSREKLWASLCSSASAFLDQSPP